MAINTGKVATAGFAAGVVLLILDVVVNGFLFTDANKAALDALNPSLYAGMESTGTMVGMAVLDVVLGMLLVWLYAVLRSSFGPGPRTAAIAGVYFWCVAGTAWAFFAVMGIFTWRYFAMSALSSLVTLQLAAYVGGMLYKDA